MSKHLPPVPPANRTSKGPAGQSDNVDVEGRQQDRQRDLAHQGRQGNIKQNTTNQGYQQDR